MRRPTWTALAAAALALAGCTDAGVQPIDDSKDRVVDDLLTISGTVCTSTPEEVQFPVKIVIIVDGSGSMQFTDPSSANTTTKMNGSTPQYNANAVASCMSACQGTGQSAAACGKICQFPSNPGRQGAAQDLVERFKNNPSVKFAIVRFNGRVTINGSDASKGAGEFTNNPAVLNKAITGLAQADITTDYQGALTATYQLLEKDMVKTNPVDRARTKYVILFLSDGGPNPVCQEGCGNDKQALPGIVVDSWCDVPRDKWCDNFFITNSTHCKDMTNWYPHMKEPCREYNTSTQLKQKVMEIMGLADQYGVGELRLNTAFLFVPTLPKPIQDLMAVYGSTNTACTTDADCPQDTCQGNNPKASPPVYGTCSRTGKSCYDDKACIPEYCVDKKCKGPSEKLLIDMAKWGDGVFRNFSSGQQIDFLSFNYSTVARPFGMTNFIVSNQNSLPSFDKLLADSDGDGVPDEIEEKPKLKMRNNNPDSDGDGYNDKMEYDRLTAGFDPGDPKKPETKCETKDQVDLDGDGLNACEERVLGTDTKLPDTDRDRIPDGLEHIWGTNPLAKDDKRDMDFDGKLNGEEIRLHANPTKADPKIHATYKYIYDVRTEPAGPELRQCFDFNVRRIRLVTTTESAGSGSLGYNNIMVYFSEGPADDPLDYGKYKAACVRAQYVEESFKFPADGKVKLHPEDFMEMSKLLQLRAAAAKNPKCKTSPPDPACSDPCMGARVP